MSFEAQALYDFSGEPNTAEMSIKAGEILKITRTDVGEGWWEGLNSSGKSGLFPEAYVTKLGSVEDFKVPSPPKNSDDWEDDWDEDTYSEIAPNHIPHQEQIYANEINDNISINDPEGFQGDAKGTVSKKSLNRFAPFVKNGGESYLLGQNKLNVPEEVRVRILMLDENVYSWPSMQTSYTVQVTSPKKESKLKGLKSFIAYQLTPSFNSIQVSRRYKHFDWLHERLTEKFSLLAIPPLPDKQISGRYEEQFIEHRRAQLQEFVDYVCRHPVLSKCEVWQHFLTCTDDKLWKQGKRQAEKDPFIGANFCLCIEAPEKTLLPSVAENLEALNVNFINGLDAALKNLLINTNEVSKKYKTIFAKEHIKTGNLIMQLGSAMVHDKRDGPSKVANAVQRLGFTYTDIGDMYERQPYIDWDPLGDKLYIYKGVTNSFQGIFSFSKAAQNKRKEYEKSITGQAMTEIKARSDVLTYTNMAELNHFKNERDTDLKMAIKKFVEGQIEFYQNIVTKLQNTLIEFDGN